MRNSSFNRYDTLNLNNTSHPSEADEFFEEEHEHGIEIWYWTLRWLIAAITSFGNGFLIILTASRKRLRTKKNCYVLSLAVADVLIGSFCTPTEFLETINVLPPWPQLDDIQTFLFDVSSTCLCAMTLDRYMAVMHPFKYTLFIRKTQMMTLILLSWVIPLLLRLPLMFTDEGNSIDAYDCFTIFLLRGLPLILLPVAFARVVRVARRARRRIITLRMQVAFNHRGVTLPDDIQSPLDPNSSVNATTAVILLYCCTNALDVYDMLCGFFKPDYRLGGTASRVGVLLVHLNSAINFIVYGLLKSDFRREMKASCCFSC